MQKLLSEDRKETRAFFLTTEGTEGLREQTWRLRGRSGRNCQQVDSSGITEMQVGSRHGQIRSKVTREVGKIFSLGKWGSTYPYFKILARLKKCKYLLLLPIA